MRVFFAAAHPLRDAPFAARQATVLAQLVLGFGPAAGAALAYHQLDWNLEPLTSVPGDEQLPQVPLRVPAALREP